MLCNLTNQVVDDALTDRISFGRFAGFSFDCDTPDSTTISRFRNHLSGRGLDEKLLDMLNRQLENHGLIVKEGAIADASIVSSSRRPRKAETIEAMDEEVQDDPGYEVSEASSDDIAAKWTIKGKPAYYGYKLHVGTDAEHGFIVGGHVTPANRSDTLKKAALMAGPSCAHRAKSAPNGVEGPKWPREKRPKPVPKSLSAKS